MNDARAMAISAVMREIAEFGAGEIAALERRAAVLGVKPSVLARNLIQTGLRGRDERALSAAVERLAAAVAELRDLVT